MIDAHTHLNTQPLFGDWQSYIQRFRDIGGQWLVNIGIDEEHNLRACQISQESLKLFPDLRIKCVVGIHPSEVIQKKKTKADLDQIRGHIEWLLRDHAGHIVAIGECGVDLHYPDSQETLMDQQVVFRVQCEIAREYDLPVVIHSRDAFDETMDVLQDFVDLKIYLHCRGYTPVEVKRCVELFPQLWIGYTGTVTYPKAVEIRESLLVTPLSSILTETDAPYLAPQPMRGKTNEPSFVQHTASFMAEQLDCDQQIFVDNARRLYGG